MQTYTLRDIASLLGLSRSVVTGLIDSGFVTPARGPRREYRFSFQDMVLLRAAAGLHAAQIAPRKILGSLRRLRAQLPAELPLTGLRLTAVGNEVAVRERGTRWQADSGQLLFDFELDAPEPAPVRPLRRTDRSAQPERQPEPAAVDWFQRGVELEPTDKRAAAAAYRRAIAAAPASADAYLNLGVLLGETAHHAQAVALYREGLDHCPQAALLHYNLAVALEDASQPAAAIESYERCLALDPALADAHFNIARLHERLGRAKLAIRHYSAYRRLWRQQP